MTKIVLVAPSDAYLFHFRGALAQALLDSGHEVPLVSPPGPYGDLLVDRGFRWFPAPMVRAAVVARPIA